VQSGSLVTPDYLRFDFSHLRAVRPEEMQEIEQQANDAIRSNLPVVSRILSKESALDHGAIALFGEKYGDTVRMISVEQDEEHPHSRELCGGTHVRRTGEIGSLFILGESSIGAGLRRLEAITGREAVNRAREQQQRLERLASLLSASPTHLEERLTSWKDKAREKDRQIAALQQKLARAQLGQLLASAQQVDGITLLGAQVDLPDMARLRETGDMLRERLGSAVLVLGSIVDDQVRLVAMVTPDLVAQGYHAGHILRQVAEIVDGTGGGRPEMAQGGGRSPERLQQALAQTPTIIREQLAVRAQN